VSKELRFFAVVVILVALAGEGALAGDGSADSTATRHSAGTLSEPTETLQEVTVTAHRIELEKRVSKFVNQIAATENGAEGLARWQAPAVCPLVSGLPKQDGEFILERLSEIARAAGVPLSDNEHCRPNLYVLVTDDPEKLLRGMEKRNRGFTFGYDASFSPPTETPATVVDEFIRTPRAVRVWYNSIEKDVWNNPVSYCPVQDVLPTYGQMVLYMRCSRGIAGGSHLVLSAKWTISSAFVIVDRSSLRKVKLQQLADYVAMSGFAKIKPDARLGDATTILTLFNGAPETAPTAMTDWDQTFLQSLYATDQKLKTQRSAITHQMVSELKR
jgi:hypothetical protein